MKNNRIIIALVFAGLLSPAAKETGFCGDGFEMAAKVKKQQNGSKSKKKSGSRVTTVYSDPETGEWIHRANKSIVVHRDAEGVVRAMSPFKATAATGQKYADALNQFAAELRHDGVNVYSLIGPTQGAFYMPAQIEDNNDQSIVIKEVAEYFSPLVTPIFVSDNLRKHIDEEIYNHTDHHWAPLGAFYAAEEFADRLGLPFLPLEQYEADTVRNYVGSMYNFSGDVAVKNNPEEFVYYITPGDYYAEIIDYKIVNQETKEESEKREGSIYRKFPDGSGGAYSTYLGGDRSTVRIVNREAPNDRRLLVVKDSFGNALAPCLINSFEEVHIIDFRYFPHNLLDYVRDNGISDLVFVNCPSIAFSQNFANRAQFLLTTEE